MPERSCQDVLRTSSQGASQRFVITSSQAGQRLDRVLASLTSATRSHIKSLLGQQRVRVAGELKKAGYLVRAQEQVEVFSLPGEPTVAVPQEIPLGILYEDDFLAAINKPAGMVVHPAPGQWEGTIVNALLFRWGQPESRDSCRPGIVHRLDKDTSGVLLVARDQKTLERLAQQFKERQVHKVYVAVVYGHFSSSEGEIILPIGRHPVDRKKMSVYAKRGRPAISRYQVIGRSHNTSFLRLFPETGRTHQLRVHLAAIGHPIIGDKIYGSHHARDPRALRGQEFPRQALHAEAIRFCHPVTQATLTIHAPYPQDLAQLLTRLNLNPEEAGSRKVDSDGEVNYGKT